MSENKVLIAYGTRYGSTEEISQNIAKILEEKGIGSDIINLKKIKQKQWPLPEDYKGVLVGSSIKIFRWMKEPTKFLKKNKDKFKELNIPLGLFISCGTAITDPEKAKKDYLEKKMEDIGVKTDLYDTFGAIYDFSETSRFGRFAKSILLDSAEELKEKRGIILKDGEKYVLIDKDRLNAFVEQFIKRLNL